MDDIKIKIPTSQGIITVESLNNSISNEASRPFPLYWQGKTKRDFEIVITEECIKDWENINKSGFNESNKRYVKIKEYIKDAVDGGLGFPIPEESSEKARKIEARVSSSGRGKQNDSRIYFTIFDKSNKIYLCSISSQHEHHKDERDTKAIDRADKVIKRLNKELNDKPI